jgi:hypothetical protein
MDRPLTAHRHVPELQGHAPETSPHRAMSRRCTQALSWITERAFMDHGDSREGSGAESVSDDQDLWPTHVSAAFVGWQVRRSAPGKSRTCYLGFRKALLYPNELRGPRSRSPSRGQVTVTLTIYFRREAALGACVGGVANRGAGRCHGRACEKSRPGSRGQRAGPARRGAGAANGDAPDCIAAHACDNRSRSSRG